MVVQDKFPLAKSVHKWFGRAMNLYAFLVAWTGKIFFQKIIKNHDIFFPRLLSSLDIRVHTSGSFADVSEQSLWTNSRV